MVATARRRQSASSGAAPTKKTKPSSPPDNGEVAGPSMALYDDPMIDPTDSSGSEDDASDLESDIEDAAEDFGDEAEVDAEEQEEQTAPRQPSAGPSRPTGQQHTRNLYAPPTIEEIERLKSASETGNTFTLQLEALVGSTLLPTQPHPALKNLLSRIHDLILGLPSLPAVSPEKALKRTKDVPIVSAGDEFSPLKGDIKWTLGWEKPAEVFVGGSWSVCGGYKKGKGVAGDVDLVVVMPPSLFSPKDRMNYRYFHKRSHYLAVIKKAIAKAFEGDAQLKEVHLEWANTMDDARRPIIVLRAGKGQGLKHQVEIKIYASAPPGIFPSNSLSPTKSLLRIQDSDAPTPLYTSSLAHDSLQKAHLLNLHQIAQSLPERDVASFLALWRIWATRRGLAISRGASGWFGGMLLSWTVDGGHIGGQGGLRERTKAVKGLGKGLGYWGALRAGWEFLARTDFHAQPTFVGSGETAGLEKGDFCKAFKNVLVEPTGMVNVFADWEEGEVQMLRHHARETLAMLEDHSVDRFEEVFVKPSKAHTAYDEVIVIEPSSTDAESAFATAEQPDDLHRQAHSIASILRRGFSDRARIVHVTPRDGQIHIGIVFEPTQATRVLDVGPSSDKSVEGEAFRQLWGEKAELRRFKDGSIAESVVWDIARPEEAALIPLRIVKWLLLRHFTVSSEDVHSRTSGAEWLSVVQVPALAREATCTAGSEKLGFSPIMKAYDELYRLLKSIDDQLPLAILNVVPADEALRYSSTFIPHPIDVGRSASAPDCLKYVSSAEVILQFESSPRWPDDLGAIQKLKLALLDKLAKVLVASMKGVRAEIVLDGHAAGNDIEDQAGLELLLPTGVAFRLRIHHEKEKIHLERIIAGDAPVFGTSLPLPPRRLAIPALDHYLSRFVYRPSHHSALAPLHHRYPSYSSATRLLKRWFASHMLSLHVPSEAIELIMAGVYLDPRAQSVPASATAGFARAVTRLAEWDWRGDAMVVPIVSATRDAAAVEASGRVRFPETVRKEAEEAFRKRRSKDAEVVHGAWCIVTETDTDGVRWTKNKPSKVVVGRVQGLAKATVEAMSAPRGVLSVKSIFKTQLSPYDILIHLRPALLPRYAQAVEPETDVWESRTKYRNVGMAESVYGSDVKIGFDPAAAFARDIQRLYGDSLLAFHDDLGGSVLGLLWNPTKDGPRAFKPFLGYSTQPVKSNSELVQINKDAILAEISRMGEGLIEKIERGKVIA